MTGELREKVISYLLSIGCSGREIHKYLSNATYPCLHIKSGKKYLIEGIRLDCTNVNADKITLMVCYTDGGNKFIREINEFREKFSFNNIRTER